MWFLRIFFFFVLFGHHSPTYASQQGDLLPMTMKKLRVTVPTLEVTCLDEMLKSAFLRHLIHPMAKKITLAVGEARLAEGENIDYLVEKILIEAPELKDRIDSSCVAQMLERMDIDGVLCDGSLVNPKRLTLSKLDSKIPNGKELIKYLIAELTHN